MNISDYITTDENGKNRNYGRMEEKRPIIIAENYDDFMQKIMRAEIDALNNTDYGKEITKSLLVNSVKRNPNLTPAEWKDIQSNFLVYVFCQLMLDKEECKKELLSHVYEEARRIYFSEVNDKDNKHE